MNRNEITVLVPVFNEPEVRLNDLITEILSHGYHLIIVDDGSMPPVRHSLAKVTLLRHNINLGQGAAIETGMQYARQKNIEIIVHMDADGQHKADEIKNLIQPLLNDECDVVFGSRFLSKSSINLIPSGRKRLLRLARWINVFFTGVVMSDVHNGFRALNAKAIRSLTLSMPGRGHASEIVFRTVQNKLRYYEVPVHIEYRQPDQLNSIGIKEGISLLKMLLWARYKKFDMPVPAWISRERTHCLSEAGIAPELQQPSCLQQ